MASSLELNLSPGSSKTPINEELYNPNGVEIHYGYDGKAVYGDEEDYAYSAITQTPGLHNITLSRPLASGEKVVFRWRNNYILVIYCDDSGKTRVRKTIGGTYQEIGKWLDEEGNFENTCPKFNDNVLTKRFDYIETKKLREF